MHRLRYTSNLSEDEFQQRCLRQKIWYHSFYFDNGFQIRGDYNIGADVADYAFPDLRGKSVLDVGTASGWFAYYFEQMGAEVVTLDARGNCDLDKFGRWEYPPPDADGRQPDRRGENGAPIFDSVLSGSFWIMRDILGSKIQFLNARVYEIRPELFGGRKFDLIFMGALLCHLRDPIGALQAARSVSNGVLIASSPVVIGEPEGEFMPRQYLPYTGVHDLGWWLPNEACFRLWFKGAGFQEVDIAREVTLRCDIEYRDPQGRLANQDQRHRVAHARI